MAFHWSMKCRGFTKAAFSCDQSTWIAPALEGRRGPVTRACGENPAGISWPKERRSVNLGFRSSPTLKLESLRARCGSPNCRRPLNWEVHTTKHCFLVRMASCFRLPKGIFNLQRFWSPCGWSDTLLSLVRLARNCSPMTSRYEWYCTPLLIRYPLYPSRSTVAGDVPPINCQS